MIASILPNKYTAAIKICTKLLQNGYEALFAGGIVRDMLMEKNTSDDIDIATNAKPSAITELFPHTIPVGAQFGVIIVVEDGLPFEVATFRCDFGTTDGRHPSEIAYTDAKNDAMRRDFTINGLFFNPFSHEVIDYVNGRNDISAGIIRAIGEPEQRFQEDYLRMLRAVRFAARFNFQIDEATWQALCKHAEKIREISVERIFSELNKMLCSSHQRRALNLLDQSGLLPIILPEVAALKGVEQPKQFHPEGDVFAHVKKAMGLLGDNPLSVLAWSTLLHDIGKPVTKSETDRIRFNSHDQVGMKMAQQLLKRFHTSNIFIDEVTTCIANHMNFMQVQKMRLGTLKKFLSRSTIDIELELHRIDCMASHGNCENYHFLKEQLKNIKTAMLKPEPYIHGRDLIALGFKPGPKIGEILSLIYDLQLEEEITTKEEALRIVMDKFGGSINK
jgi:putative nucleotidyltransferase with HDIG domain